MNLHPKKHIYQETNTYAFYVEAGLFLPVLCI